MSPLFWSQIYIYVNLYAISSLISLFSLPLYLAFCCFCCCCVTPVIAGRENIHFILKTSHFVYDGRIFCTSSGEVVNLRSKIQLYISLWNSEINCIFVFLKCHVNVFTLLVVAAWSDLLISFSSYWKLTYWLQNIHYTKQT